MKCLFWNTNGRDRSQLIADLVRERGIDIIAIAEPGAAPQFLIEELMARTESRYSLVESATQRLQVVAGENASGLKEREVDASGKMVFHLLGTGTNEIVFVFVHLISRLRWDADSQAIETQVLAEDIRRFEDKIGHRRTILMGDLNMQPFDTAVVQAAGLHATMTMASARRGTRTVQRRAYPYFYNPMWNFFGDRIAGPPGTCSFPQNGKHISYDWSIFDQVLIRPEMLERFVDVEIVTHIGATSLRAGKADRPGRKVGSDHFPLILTLNNHS